MTVVVDEEITVAAVVAVEVMVHPPGIALNVVALVIGHVTVQMLVEVVLAGSLPNLVVVAGETVFLHLIGLVIVTWTIVMMVVVTGTVTQLTAETGMLQAVIVMPVIAIPHLVISMVQTGMELQIVMRQVVMVGSEKEAMREMEFVVVPAMIEVAQGVVLAMTGMDQGVAWVVGMTGMVHVVVSLIAMAVEDLHAMMEEVTGRGLDRMIAPAGEEGVLMITTDGCM
jgi:hypothetical protein